MFTVGVQVLENQCHAGAASKQVYKAMVANACRAAGQCTILPQHRVIAKEQLPANDGAPGSSTASQVRSANTIWKAIAALLGVMQQTPELKEGLVHDVVLYLQEMNNASITHAELANGLGKQLKALSKHPNTRLAQAAKTVVDKFRHQLVSKSATR